MAREKVVDIKIAGRHGDMVGFRVAILEQLALSLGIGVVARQVHHGRQVVGYEVIATHREVEVTWGHEDPYVAIVGALRDVVQESWKKNATVCPEAPILVKPMKPTVVRRRGGEKSTVHPEVRRE